MAITVCCYDFQILFFDLSNPQDLCCANDHLCYFLNLDWNRLEYILFFRIIKVNLFPLGDVPYLLPPIYSTTSLIGETRQY
jgi:hypothetical protein